MHDANYTGPVRLGAALSILAAFLMVGCQSAKNESSAKPMSGSAPAPAAAAEPAPAVPPPAPPAAPAAVAEPAMTNAPAMANGTIRIDAGASAAYTDPDGNVWKADEGFQGGDVTDRPSDMAIANTKDAGLYRTEHYGMTSFSQELPNGPYTVKLHFAETYDGVSGLGQRVFGFNVEGHEFKDFDVWAKAGGGQKAYVETVKVDVTDGKLDITFTPSGDQSPEINGIEIIPGN